MTDNKHEFDFVIEGEGVSPSTVALRDLVEILSQFQDVVTITATQKANDGTDDMQLHLVRIGEGSDRLTLLAGDRMYDASAKVTKAIATNKFDDIPLPAQDGLRKLSRRARAKNWSFRVSPHSNGAPKRRKMVEAAITPESEFLLPTEITGGTALLVKIDRIGGESSPTAWVILPNGDKLTAELKNKEMAQQLKARLFKFAVLEGNAVWDYESWKIERFKVERIGEYEDTSPREAFERLSEAAGNRWENIDPEEFVTELRGE